MPTRIAAFRPARIALRVSEERPNAHARGYCSPAWFAIRRAVLVRDAWQCQACGRVCTGHREAHVHHRMAKVDGGADTLDNLSTMCVRCHSRETFNERRARRAKAVAKSPMRHNAKRL